MKSLKQFINEKILINKTSKYSYNPDYLSSHSSEMWDSEDEDSYYENFIEDINYLEEKYDHFICFRFYSISECNVKNLTDRLIEYDLDLQTLIEKRIITGNDLGYEVRLKDGHIEVDAINSGSRGTYYIYACSDEVFEYIRDFYELDEGESEELYKLLFTEGEILPIEF